VTDLPPQVAVHESTGDVYVAYGADIVKLSGINGDVIWATKIPNADIWDSAAGANAITVDQETGDAYISAFHDANVAA